MATDDMGFASMDEQKRKDMASKGGQSQNTDNNPASFAEDTKKASEAGKKGGETSHRNDT